MKYGFLSRHATESPAGDVTKSYTSLCTNTTLTERIPGMALWWPMRDWHVHSPKLILSLTQARVIRQDRTPIVKMTPLAWPVCKPAGAFPWLMIDLEGPSLPWEVPPLGRWSWMVQKSYVIHLPCAFQFINLVMPNVIIFSYFLFFFVLVWFTLLDLKVFKYLLLFSFTYMSILPIFVSVYNMCPWWPWKPETGS